jgi:hypothetical protein
MPSTHTNIHRAYTRRSSLVLIEEEADRFNYDINLISFH